MAISIADPIRAEPRLAERLDVAFLLLDGVRRPRQAKSQEVTLCALGMDRDARPRPLALRAVAVEGEQAWLELLRSLRASGLGPNLLLICCDGHLALLRAISAVFPGTPVQISVAHRLLALAAKVDGSVRTACMAEARAIFTAPDRDTAVARFRAWRASWLRDGYRAVTSLESDLASCLTFYRFPQSLWRRIRTVNVVERAFREARLAVFGSSEGEAPSDPPAHEPEAPAPVEEPARCEAITETLAPSGAPNGHAHKSVAHVRDLTFDADFTWWLRQTRQQTDTRVRDLIVAAASVLIGVALGLVGIRLL